MFTLEDYKLIDDLARLAIERLDERSLDGLLILRSKIGNVIANDEIEQKRLLDYLETKIKEIK